MISEADTVSSLKHGCQRAVFIGNPILNQGMFLINSIHANRTLFSRVGNFKEIY